MQLVGIDIRAAEQLFVGQWGKLLEALVEPGVLRLFQERGIDVNRSLQRVRGRRDGQEMEMFEAFASALYSQRRREIAPSICLKSVQTPEATYLPQLLSNGRMSPTVRSK
jgi:hypothetical protein